MNQTKPFKPAACHRSKASAVLLSVVSACPLVPAACGKAYRPPDNPIPGSVVLTRGDWDDIGAAVLVGAGWAEMTPLSSQQTETSVVFLMITIDEEPGLLIVTPGSGGRLELRSVVGAAGERERDREAALLRAVSRRLQQLSGVDAAPVR